MESLQKRTISTKEHDEQEMKEIIKRLKKQKRLNDRITPYTFLASFFKILSHFDFNAYFYDQLFIDTDPVNNIILGMTRSGKGEYFVLSSIDAYSRPKDLADKASMIISDPKGELATMTSQKLQERGYKVLVFSLRPPMDGISYNPLQIVKEAYVHFLELTHKALLEADAKKRAGIQTQADTEEGYSETYAKSLAYVLNYDPGAKEKIWQEWGTAITTAAIMAVTVDCCEAADKCLTARQLLMQSTIQNGIAAVKEIDEFREGIDQAMEDEGSEKTAEDYCTDTVYRIPKSFPKMAQGDSYLGISYVGNDKYAYTYYSMTCLPIDGGFCYGKNHKDAVMDALQIEAEKWYARVNMYSVALFITDYCKPDPKSGIPPLDNYIMHKQWTAKLQYSPVNAADGRTKGNITAEAMAKLTQLTLTPVAKLLSKNDFNFSDIGFDKQPVALFLVTPDEDHSNDFILTMFIEQLYQMLARRASASKSGKCARDVIFLLDELGNMPAFPDMEHMITVGLGRRFYFELIIQDYAMLEHLYGKEAAVTIKGNCGNHIFLLSNNAETRKEYSQAIGNKSVVVNTRFGSPLEAHKNMQESAKAIPLLSADSLSELGDGDCVVVRAIHRQTLAHRRAIQYPIFNYHGDHTELIPRYKYLKNTFPSGGKFSDLRLDEICTHNVVQLEDIVYDPIHQGLYDAAFPAQSEQDSRDNEEKATERIMKPTAPEPSMGEVLAPKDFENLIDNIQAMHVKNGLSKEIFSTMTVTEFEGYIERELGAGNLAESACAVLHGILEEALEKDGEVDFERIEE